MKQPKVRIRGGLIGADVVIELVYEDGNVVSLSPKIATVNLRPDNWHTVDLTLFVDEICVGVRKACEEC